MRGFRSGLIGCLVVGDLSPDLRDNRKFDYSAALVDGRLQLEFELNEAREEEHIAAMGKMVIFTDMENLSPCQFNWHGILMFRLKYIYPSERKV